MRAHITTRFFLLNLILQKEYFCLHIKLINLSNLIQTVFYFFNFQKLTNQLICKLLNKLIIFKHI